MSAICDDLRASILQAAMRGELTSRYSSDDNSATIKESIIKERSRYKANKFIENDNNDDNMFPKEWCSLKTGEVFELLTGEKVTSGSKLPLLDAKYFRGKQQSFATKGSLANKGDVLILVDGENSGETFLCDEPGYMGSTFKGLFIPKCINKDFALYFLEMNRKILRDNKRGAAIPHLDKKLFFNFVFPIPSLAEQKRIVEKVDELMARVADLEQSADALASLKKAFPSDIKAALLQAAMQGKLTEQLPEDGSADELLEQIKTEKERLISEGKIKKQKALAPIVGDEIPFNIPDNWKWVRLLDICEQIGDIDHNMPKASSSGGVPFLSAKDINDDFSLNFNHDIKMISLEDYERLGRKMRPQKGDIIFSRIGSLGKTAIVETDEKFLVSYSCCIMRPLIINLRFFAYYLICPIIQLHIRNAKTGIGVPDLGMGEIKACLMPLPPLAEQKRIVERLDVLMQNIDVVSDLITSE